VEQVEQWNVIGNSLMLLMFLRSTARDTCVPPARHGWLDAAAILNKKRGFTA
jgi:hypothetical protein